MLPDPFFPRIKKRTTFRRLKSPTSDQMSGEIPTIIGVFRFKYWTNGTYQVFLKSPLLEYEQELEQQDDEPLIQCINRHFHATLATALSDDAMDTLQENRFYIYD